MKKFQVSIQFMTDKEFTDLVPAHKTYINYLINKEIIEHYAVSMAKPADLDHVECGGQ